MCHEYTARERVWELDDADGGEQADDELPEFLSEEAETTSELVTDGGDDA